MTLLRPFRPDDSAACLAIFDSNTPKFFAPQERDEFRSYLASLGARSAPYLVLETDGVLRACGGLEVAPDSGEVHLTWGMVDQTCHGQRLGTRLTEARLALARTLPGATRLILSTSQHTQGFYARFGFTVTRITPDGFGPGLDRWDMALPLAPPTAPPEIRA